MALLPASGQPSPHPVPAPAVSTLWFALQGAAQVGLLHLARPGHSVAVRWVTLGERRQTDPGPRCAAPSDTP